MIAKTAELRDLVAPEKLEELLEMLLFRGDLVHFKIGKSTTTITPSITFDIAFLIKEESRPRENPRPYVANRLTKKNKRV